MATQKYYDAAPEIIASSMKELGELTGREYNLFDYFGGSNPEKVIVSMGSSIQTIQETLEYLNEKEGDKYGLLAVRLYRPWSIEHFMKVLPPSVQKIAVLDRCREEGCAGLPLYLDVLTTFKQHADKLGESNKHPVNPVITSGIYGLSSKNLTPGMVKAVYDNLDAQQPKTNYTLGINDDVTFTSLDYSEDFSTIAPGTKQCIFWGRGSDGTIGANKSAISIIANNTKWHAQGSFQYDAYKTDGTTLSNLRFGPKPIRSEYKILNNADYISCNEPTYVKKYEMVDKLKERGIFVINSSWNTLGAMEKNLPGKMRRTLAEKKAKLYNIDAGEMAKKIGLGNRINMIMQTAFFKLSEVLPIEGALELLKEDIGVMYKDKKGSHTVKMNRQAVDWSSSAIKRIKYPTDRWLNAKDEQPEDMSKLPGIVKEVSKELLHWKGDALPVSKFEPGGYIFTPGLTKYEKRGIAGEIPIWEEGNCICCNHCSIICPHAAIRPFLLNKAETQKAPKGFRSRRAIDAGTFNMSIQVSPLDCTGCQLCATICPSKCLDMTKVQEVNMKKEIGYWEYAQELSHKKNPADRGTVKGSQFEEPLLQFSGACSGCGETPVMKLITQLFGERMMIANATGCSRVWGGMFPHLAYGARKLDGKGPAFAHSLFEDNAEFGYGMVRAQQTRRNTLEQHVRALVAKLPDEHSGLIKLLRSWIENKEDPEKCGILHPEIMAGLKEVAPNKIPDVDGEDGTLSDLLERVMDGSNLFTVNSYWFIGGDGWAYDIGYGGLDHILNTDADFNILVMDNEGYANTGFQMSKSTPLGASMKYSLAGKNDFKKDLGMTAMSQGNVYVASINLFADLNHAMNCIKEADSFPGPSIILAFTPCIGWGMPEMKDGIAISKQAVDSGYWPLYSFDPRREDNKFHLDSKRIKIDAYDFLNKQQRFRKLNNESPERFKELQEKLQLWIREKHGKLVKMGMENEELFEHLQKTMGTVEIGEKTLILYGSETGNAHYVARNLEAELKQRGVRTKLMAMDNYNMEDLPTEKNVYCVISTAGQGEFPNNAKHFMKELHDPLVLKGKGGVGVLKGVNFAVFGLGDSSYFYYNKAAEELDNRLQYLGGNRLLDMGKGNDKDEDRYETAWEEWAPKLFDIQALPEPEEVIEKPSYHLHTIDVDEGERDEEYIPKGQVLVPLKTNQLLTPDDYDRDIRHYELDTTNTDWSYSVGDILSIYPQNPPYLVDEFMDRFGYTGNENLGIKLKNPSMKLDLPSHLKSRTLFTKVLDVFGKPNNRFYKFIHNYATGEEKEELKYLISKEGKAMMQELKDETTTYADLLERYPSSLHSADYLLEAIPHIKPRLYSIASSQEMHGDTMQLCIIYDDWTTPSGKYRSGLTTTYLRKLKPGDKLASSISKSGCAHPQSHKTPVVLVGLGTGIAPLRAMAQERAKAKQEGEEVGPMNFYFGMRYRETEYLYGNELEGYARDGVISNLRPAFSRDQDHKIYVHHHMEQDMKIIYEQLVKQNGYFLLCGSAKATDTHKALLKAFKEVGGMTDKQADEYIQTMKREGRYNLDVW